MMLLLVEDRHCQAGGRGEGDPVGWACLHKVTGHIGTEVALVAQQVHMGSEVVADCHQAGVRTPAAAEAGCLAAEPEPGHIDWKAAPLPEAHYMETRF
jgi:hypothetical protein